MPALTWRGAGPQRFLLWTISCSHGKLDDMNFAIASLEKHNLGMAREGKVDLQLYTSLWEKAATLEIDRLGKALGRVNYFLHHIGSTSFIQNILRQAQGWRKSK
jgi:hypothetical protein